MFLFQLSYFHKILLEMRKVYIFFLSVKKYKKINFFLSSARIYFNILWSKHLTEDKRGKKNLKTNQNMFHFFFFHFNSVKLNEILGY